MTREILKGLAKPRWDGSSTTWKAFWLEWKLYWKTCKRLVGRQNKALFFVALLPRTPHDWHGHFMALITEREWTFSQIAQFLHQQYTVLVPDWQKLRNWKNCLPAGKTYMDYVSWYLRWERLGSDCTPSQEDWINEFNKCMAHQGYFAVHMRAIVETEVAFNMKMNLAQRVNFVLNKLRISHQADQHLAAQVPSNSRPYTRNQSPGRFQSRPRGNGSGPVCFRCQGTGHLAANCPKLKRSDGPKPFTAGKSQFQRPSGQSAFQRPSGSSGATNRPSTPQRVSFANQRGPKPSGGGSHPPGYPDKATALARRKAGQCILCAQPGHGWRDCPRNQRAQAPARHVSPSGRRPPSPRPSLSSTRATGPSSRPSGPSARPLRPPSGPQSRGRFYPSSGSEGRRTPPRPRPSGSTSVRAVNAFTSDDPVELYSEELDYNDLTDAEMDDLQACMDSEFEDLPDLEDPTEEEQEFEEEDKAEAEYEEDPPDDEEDEEAEADY